MCHTAGTDGHRRCERTRGLLSTSWGAAISLPSCQGVCDAYTHIPHFFGTKAIRRAPFSVSCNGLHLSRTAFKCVVATCAPLSTAANTLAVGGPVACWRRAALPSDTGNIIWHTLDSYGISCTAALLPPRDGAPAVICSSGCTTAHLCYGLIAAIQCRAPTAIVCGTSSHSAVLCRPRTPTSPQVWRHASVAATVC